MDQGEGPRRVVSLTARTLRCLAHPLRLRLLEMLRSDGSATASGLARRVGENSANVSWHLRQLAEAGFVEEDRARGNRRDRWWRSVHDATNLDADELITNPEFAGPLSSFLHELNAQRFEAVSTAITALPGWPREWQLAGTLSDTELSLTPAETVELRSKLLEVIDSYRRAPKPDDAAVTVHVNLFPRGLGDGDLGDGDR